MAKVGAVLVDYDGTVAPLGIPRNESRMFRSVESALRKIATEVPVCVVTAKDFDFIHPRSRFAAGWACVSGLDVRLADGRVVVAERLRNIEVALQLARACESIGTYTELKRGPSGELLGVVIDWTGVPETGRSIVRRLRALPGHGLKVYHDRNTTYADVYAGVPDKGKATRVLCRLLKVQSYVMFIGDSPLDNAAFQEAGIAIGVAHGQPMEELRCDLVVEQSGLAEFLRSLAARGMDFTPSLPGVRTKGELIRLEGRSHNVSDQSHKGSGAGGRADGQGAKAPGARGLPGHQRVPRPG